MKHLRLLLKLVTGLLWAVLVGLVGAYLVLNEEYRDGFEDWLK